MEAKKFEIVYADPPWSYDSKQDVHNGKPVHYKTMSVTDLKALEVSALTAENCALFMWVVPALLQEAIAVGESWGFAYKTKAFCWVKKNKISDSLFWGQGYYTRSNTEDCLLFLRGRMKRDNASVHQVVYEPLREHSRKPDCVRERIVKLFGDRPRIELFARHRHPGWACWGNEVDSDVEIKIRKYDDIQN